MQFAVATMATARTSGSVAALKQLSKAGVTIVLIADTLPVLF